MRTGFGILSVVCLLGVTLAAAPVVAQAQTDAAKQKKKKKLNVDFTVGWGGCYRPRQWTPITVGVTTPYDKPLGVEVSLSSRQDGLNKLNISRAEVLMPDQRQDIPLVTKLDFGNNDATLTLLGTESSFYWRHTYDLWNSNTGSRPLTALQNFDALIGVTGSQGFSIMDVQRASAAGRGGRQGKVYMSYRFPRLLPSDWTAYASLDILVLYNVEWTELTTAQRRAIVQYISNGGSVLMVLGNKPLPATSELALMLPLKIGDPREIQLSPRDLSNWGCQRPKTTKVTCWQARMDSDAHDWTARNDRNGNTYLVSGHVGFGKVSVLLFDPTQIGCRQGRDLASFWVPLMAKLGNHRNISQVNSPDQIGDDWSYEFNLGPEREQAEKVLDYLYAIEELKPIHIGWVVMVLAALALLIGPVDYLLLKAFGKLPWTWVTSTACIAIFSVGAYYGVEYIRGGELQAKMISVVDSVQGSGDAWATRYVGIFAPHSDDYHLTGTDRSQWWAGIAPDMSDSLYGYNNVIAARSISCEQHEDGGNKPMSVPINIWSMQSLICESRLKTAPMSATVRREGSQWTVTVTNHEKTPITKCFAQVGPGRYVECGQVQPGQTQTFTGRTRNHSAIVSALAPKDYPQAGTAPQPDRYLEPASLSWGCSQRTHAIESYLASAGNAVVVCGVYDNATPPIGIEDQSCRFQHTVLARLVVFPKGRNQ